MTLKTRVKQTQCAGHDTDINDRQKIINGLKALRENNLVFLIYLLYSRL